VLGNTLNCLEDVIMSHDLNVILVVVILVIVLAGILALTWEKLK
jgi:hypothetical protein